MPRGRRGGGAASWGNPRVVSPPFPSHPAPYVPLGSSACLASLRRAAAKLEDGAAWTDKVLLAAGLPLGTMEPLRGEGVRGLTVAVVRVAVESIPKEGDFDSWLMPANETSTGSAAPRGWHGVGAAPGCAAPLTPVWLQDPPPSRSRKAKASPSPPIDHPHSPLSSCHSEKPPVGRRPPRSPPCAHSVQLVAAGLQLMEQSERARAARLQQTSCHGATSCRRRHMAPLIRHAVPVLIMERGGSG